MAAISSINGISDAALMGQVEKTARPDKVQPPTFQNSPTDKTEAPTATTAASYKETLAVAEKLQSRLDEVAATLHQVSIHTDEETKQYIIEIQDPEGNVVKRFPPEKILNLYQRLDDLSGMVIDEMI